MVPLCPLCTPSRTFTYIAKPSIPNIDDVIIPSTREKLAVSPPFESADLSSVPKEFHDFVAGNPHIVVPDTAVAAT
jgi:hypothetical protein